MDHLGLKGEKLLNKSRFGPTVGILLLGLLLLLFQDHLGGWSKTEHITKLNASIIPAANFLKTQPARAEIAEDQIPGSGIMLPGVAKARSVPDQSQQGLFTNPVTTRRLALLRLEDIGPGGNYSTPEDLGRLRAVIDYLDIEGIPFQVTVVPRYMKLKPDGTWENRGLDDFLLAPESQAFVHMLYYIQSRGGVVGIHGYSHQYGSVKRPDNFQDTFVGNEFAVNGAEDSTSLDYARERFELSLNALENIGIQPAFWETPHNVATPQQQDVFRSGIGIQYESLQKKDEKPVYLTNQNSFGSPTQGSVYIPTPLYYIEGGVKSSAMVDSLIKRLPFFNGVASFFYHPFLEFSFLEPVLDEAGQPVIVDGLPLYVYQEDKISHLKKIVNGLRDNRYSFVSIHDLIPFTPGHRVSLTESNSDPNAVLTGDFDGDGEDEFADYNGRQVSVVEYDSRLPRYRNDVSQSVWLDELEEYGTLKLLVGDFNNDNRDDLLLYSQSEGNWWVAHSKADHSFSTPEAWLVGWGKGPEWVPYTGDFNGDGLHDLLVYSKRDNHWQTAISAKHWAIPQNASISGTETGYSYLAIADTNGDDKDDLITYSPSRGLVQVTLSEGLYFDQPQTWLKGWITGKNFQVGDINGDDLADVVLNNPVDGMWFLGISLGNRFIPQSTTFGPWSAGMNRNGLLGDFDGNGKTDIGSWCHSAEAGGDWIDIAYSYQS